MKRQFKRVITFLICILLVLQPLPVSAAGSNPGDPVEAFVSRMYHTVLGREPEEQGLNDWASGLKNGSLSAIDIVRGFFWSDEYCQKNKTNEELVTDCYKAMLDRSPDEAGFNDWVMRLDIGMSADVIYAGFVGSTEFGNLCSSYGITPGTYSVTQERDKSIEVTSFVSRLYSQALGRSFDVDGLNNWCGVINNDRNRETVRRVATDGFFHSEEFTGKNLDNSEYVKVLYRTFVGREYDEQGYNYWLEKLSSGESRDSVLSGFAGSQEFNAMIGGFPEPEPSDPDILFIGDSRTVYSLSTEDARILGEKIDGVTVYAACGQGYDFTRESIADYGDGYDILAVWMGCNDAAHGRDFLQTYAPFYEQLLARGKKIILFNVGRIDDSYVSDEVYDYYDWRMVEYNESMYSWARDRAGVTYVDIYSVSQGWQLDPDDGIHYAHRPNRGIWDKLLSYCR